MPICGGRGPVAAGADAVAEALAAASAQAGIAAASRMHTIVFVIRMGVFLLSCEMNSMGNKKRAESRRRVALPQFLV
jgi:hypothetical protein